MAWDKGFNFRANLSYVDDVAPETHVVADAYPTTRNGSTFGWNATSSLSIRDRNSGIDRRLAGVHFPNTVRTFTVDLPRTGEFIVTSAMGDSASSAFVDHYAQFRDDATAFITIDHSPGSDGPVVDQYLDSTDVIRAEADWVAENVTVTRDFTSTTLNIVVGNNTGLSCITHLLLSEIAASTQMPMKDRVARQFLFTSPLLRM